MSAVVKIYRSAHDSAPRYCKLTAGTSGINIYPSRDLMGAEFRNAEEIKKGTAPVTLNLGTVSELTYHGLLSIHPSLISMVSSVLAPSVIPADGSHELTVTLKVKEDIPAGTTLFTLNLLD